MYMVDSSGAPLMRTGTVVGYVDGGLRVDVSTLESCRQCAEGRGCGMGMVARRQQHSIVLKPNCPTRDYHRHYPLGAHIRFTIAKSDLTLVALIVYALPLLFALMLAGGATWIGLAEWCSVTLFFGALISGVVVLRYRLRGKTEHFRPHLVN